MGIAVLVMGESGSGKSASLRNFKKGEIGVFNVANKPLPFRNKLSCLPNADYQIIHYELSNPRLKAYVVDDSQYLLAFEFFDRAKEKGYDKFTDMAQRFSNLIRFINQETPPDVIVYFLHHIETDNNGRYKAKTIGKMLDEKLTVEGLFSIVLLCESSKDKHYFVTQSDGRSTAKTPMGMFDALEIDNDLKMVDDTIREYYGLIEEDTDNEKTQKL